MTVGQADTYLFIPWGNPEERLYPIVSEIIGSLAQTSLPESALVRVVGERWSSRCSELLDLAARNSVACEFLPHDSDQGRWLLQEMGHVGSLPAVIFRDQVLGDPTNAEIADMLGGNIEPEGGLYDLVIVGAGPAGLAAGITALQTGCAWPESWRSWERVMSLAAASVRAIAIDLPGVGRSTGDATDGTKRQLAAKVHGLIAAMELKNATLIGHDIGGMVVYAYLRNHRDLARAAILDDRRAARRVTEGELTVDRDRSKRRIILRLLLGTETGFTRRLQHSERAMPTRRSRSMLFAGSLSPLFLAVLTLSLPAAAYEAVQVSEGGTINGKVVYPGEIATRKIVPTKDTETCGSIREEPLIVVGTDKGVQGVVVYLKDVQKGKALAKPPKNPEINNLNCNFEPHVQAVPTGSIVIVNSDPVMHNTHGFLGKQTVFNQAMPTKGMRIEKPIRKAGMMRIECDVHGWMLAWVYAAEHPYYAVTKKDGTFSIPDVPPGSYTLVAWQEAAEVAELPVTVKPKEATQQNIELKDVTEQNLELKKK